MNFEDLKPNWQRRLWLVKLMALGWMLALPGVFLWTYREEFTDCYRELFSVLRVRKPK